MYKRKVPYLIGMFFLILLIILSIVLNIDFYRIMYLYK